MLLLRNSMHAISPMRAAALFFHRNVHNASRIEYFYVYRINQEMHTFNDSVCTIGKLAYNELYLNIMNGYKIINPKIFPHFKI